MRQVTETETVPWRASLPFRADEPRLTRDELEEMILPVTGWTERGYKRSPVDGLIARFTAELERHAAEKADLWRSLALLRQRFRRGEDPGTVPADSGEAREMARGVLSAAEMVADRTMAATREQAERVTAAVRQQREAILADAEKRGAQIIRDAEEYAEQVRQAANDRAREAASAAMDTEVGPNPEQLVRAARAEAASLGGFAGVYVDSSLALAQTVVRLLTDCQARVHGYGAPEPPPGPPVPLKPLPQRRSSR